MPIDSNLLDEMKGTLLAGGYSLFLGAGANVGGKDRSGRELPLSDQLRQELVTLTGLKPNSSLARAYAQLKQAQIDTHLTDRFSNCVPGESLLHVPSFVWKRIYTLNIDDAVEAAYNKVTSHQIVEVKSHKSPYIDANDVNVIQVIHVHGWSTKPDDGYVFSLEEYAGAMGPNSPWTAVLAHTLATEPFIIAGTSLEEPDIEYFLRGRKSDLIRKDRGPSFLVEPNPDVGTLRDCERHGLHLYRGTLLEFFTELACAFPARPLPTNATSSMSSSLFTVAPNGRERALFSRDFSYVVPQQVPENADLAFYVGRQPTLTDVSLGRDVSRESNYAT